jgi:hypothetical protein
MAESLKQQRERIKLEREYQAALKISQSLVSDIKDDIDAEVDYRTELGKKLKSFNSDLKSSVDGLSDSASITKEIQRIEAEKDRIASSHFGKNKAIGDKKQEILDTTLASLRVEEKLQQNTEAVDKAAQKYKDNIGGALDKMTQHLSQVPVLGGMLGSLAKKGADGIKNRLGKAAEQFVVDFNEGMREGKSQAAGLANALSKSGGKVLKSIFSWRTAMVGFVALLGLSFLTMDKMQKSAIAFKQETGILNGQFAGISSKIATTSAIAQGMGGSLEDGAKAAGAMFNAFGGVEDISGAVLNNTTKLAVGMGLSADAIGNVNKLFQNAFGQSQELAQNMVNITVEASNLAGVPADKVLKDMAESSDEIYTYFKGSPQALQKAAIQAAKLGTSIKQAAGVAKGLLDFESSINSELEASALLGTNINFNQARYLAAQGDVVGSQQAVLKEVGKLGDLTKLNVYQQEALAKASGMSIGDLMNQQRIQKQLGDLKGKDLEAAQALIASGKDLSKMDKKGLQAALNQQKTTNEMNTSMDRLKGQLANVGMRLGQLLMPLATSITNFLAGDGMGYINKGITVIQNTFTKLGEWFKTNKPAIDNFLKGMGEGFGVVKDAVLKVWETIKPAFDWIGNKLAGLSGDEAGSAGGLGKKVVVLGAAFLGLKMVFPLLKMLGGGIFGLGKSLMGVGKTATQTASSSGGFLKTLGNGIKSIGQGLGGAIKSIASGLGGAMKSIGSGIGGLISGISKGIGTALNVIGKGLGGFLKGLSGGLASLANPAALIGLAAITLAFIGLAAAMRIMAPALEPLGKMFKSIFEGIAAIVVPVIEILVNGFVQLADVIGNTMIGMMQAFAPIVETVAGAFVRIAEVVGETIIGVFDSIGNTLGMVVEKSGSAGEVLAMAGAITALGGALAAFGVGAGVGAAAGGIGNAVGAIGNKFASWVSGEEQQPTGPLAMLEKLVTFGPGITTFSSQLVASMDNFDLFLQKVSESVDPINSLTQSLNEFSNAMFGVNTAAAAMDIKKIGYVTGMAGAATGGSAKLPELVSNLAEKISEFTTGNKGNTDKAILEKLDEVKEAVLISGIIEMDGEKMSNALAFKNEARKRINLANRIIS